MLEMIFLLIRECEKHVIKALYEVYCCGISPKKCTGRMRSYAKGN